MTEPRWRKATYSGPSDGCVEVARGDARGCWSGIRRTRAGRGCASPQESGTGSCGPSGAPMPVRSDVRTDRR
jgi:hypothetical protein